VIEKLAAKRLGDRSEPPSRPEIGFAGAWIAAGVVVGQEDGDSAVLCRIDDDVAERKVDAAAVAEVA